MGGPSVDFDASASAIGYLYQLRYALLAGLLEVGAEGGWSVSVEIVDDVDVQTAGGSRRLQLKHRANGTRMTDGSTDLWKTLRIWSIGVNDRSLDLATTRLMLLTTAAVPVGSAAHYLQDGAGRDVGKAFDLITAAASRSGSATNSKGIEAYAKLTERQQRAMLNRVTAVGDAPNIEGVRQDLLKCCGLAVGKKHAESLLVRLEGWFIQRCIETMRSETAAPIPGTEIDEKLDQLRAQFRPDNLPIDPEIAEMTATRDAYSDARFVRQLALAGIGNQRIELAVRDYLRAFTQRSQWSREHLLVPGELGAYERRLREEWHAQFVAMAEEIGPDAAEQQKIALARKIYSWVDLEFRHNIRPECHEAFVCKGTFQMLADDLQGQPQVGWHPDFEARLVAILEPVSGGVNADS